MSYEIRLIGGGTVGRRITDRLEYRGDAVVIIEHNEPRARSLESGGYHVYHGDGTGVETLDDAGVAEADIVIVATIGEELDNVSETIESQSPDYRP